jgi:CPA2 family monovalent cation:H+ antiporter-2
VGLAIDASTILRDWPLILGIAALIILAKAASNIAVSLVFRWSTPGSTQIGFLLAQGSEFAFVILSIPAVQNLLGPRIAAILIAAVALTLAATPTLAEIGRNLAGRLRTKAKAASNVELVPLGITASVLIFCMGTRGRTLADALTDFEISHLAVESDDRRLHEAIADGYDVMFGSMGDTRLWQPMAIERRKLIALTEPRIAIAAEVMPTILHRYPNLPLLAAATNDDEVAQFTNIGLRAVKDSADDGVDFAVAALLELGVEEVSVSNWVFKRQNIAAPVRSVAA